jgi:hypothetical protein
MQEYFTRHQDDFPGLEGNGEVSTLAAKLVVWLSKIRVLDCSHGLRLARFTPSTRELEAW